jgi:hypothetical protein
LAQLDHKVIKDQPDHVVKLDRKVTKVTLDLQVQYQLHLDLQEAQDRQVHKVLQDRKDQQVL